MAAVAGTLWCVRRTVLPSVLHHPLHVTDNKLSSGYLKIHSSLPLFAPLISSASRICHLAQAVKGDTDFPLKSVGDKSVLEEVKRVLEMARRALSRREVLHTNFLTPPVSKESLIAIGKLADTKAIVQGGYPQAERCRISVGHPDDLTGDPDIIAALGITGNFGFQSCSHGDFLGSILGTGIAREKVGDILLQGKSARVLVVPELVDFLTSSLDKVGNVPVYCTRIPLDSLDYEPPESKPFISEFFTGAVVKWMLKWMCAFSSNRTKSFKTVESSLRVDALASAGFKISRSKLVEMISNGDVRVNWTPVTKNGAALKSGDMVSVTGKGRLKIGEINSTKKGKFAVELIRYI